MEKLARIEFKVPASIKEQLQKLANRDTNGNRTKKLIEVVEEMK